MTNDASSAVLTDPVFEGFYLEIRPAGGADITATRARLALVEALAEIGRTDAGWTVLPVNGLRPGTFHLFPPESGELAVADAWSVAYLLQAQASVIDAEPSFEVVLDSGDLDADDDEEEVSAAAPGDPPIFSKFDRDWCPKLIEAPGAWRVPPHSGNDGFPPGLPRGEGVTVGHPDSGYREHAEIRDTPNRFLDEKGWDFFGDLGVEDPFEEDDHGNHGLGTASVLMSQEDGVASITGVAPMASIIPYRVTKPRLGVPGPVLFKSGMLRLARSIHHAIDEDECDVISISLGWLRNEAVEEAVQTAFDRDVIVVAAAGNQVRFFVVWPAAYESVIACAGCTSKRRRWRPSSRGPEVDVTAPAEHVWKAVRTDDGQEIGLPADGTSFSAASVAGVAALWLAHWGKQRLLDRYRGELRLTTVFRHVLFASCDPPPLGADGNWGRGIVNARRLLETDPPTLEELRAGVEPMLEALALDASRPLDASGFATLAKAIPGPPRAVLRSRLAGMLGLDEPEVEERLVGFGRETLFHILTDPLLRSALAAPSDGGAPEAPGEISLESLSADGPLPAGAAEAAEVSGTGRLATSALRERLRSRPLSTRLRERLVVPAGGLG